MTTTAEVEIPPQRRRLTRLERVGFATLTLVSIAVVLAGLLSAVAASLHFFGEQPTARDTAVSGQGLRIALWAFATPFCALAVLRRRQKARFAAWAWLTLLVGTTWWDWPPQPSEPFDDLVEPLWLDAFPLLWALVASGLATGLYAAREAGRRTWVLAVGVALAVVVLGAMSHAHLLRRSKAEKPVELARGIDEVRGLRADPLWDSLPSDVRRTYSEHPATEEPVWGEETPTKIRVELHTSERRVFVDAVAGAEGAGWVLIESDCFRSYIYGVLAKTLPVGEAHVRISLASELRSVTVTGVVATAPRAGEVNRCWSV